MEHLGFWGIIRLTKHIILKNLKHFLCIALLLAIPLALSSIVLGRSSLKASLKASQALAISTSLIYKLGASQGRLDPNSGLTPDEQALIPKQQGLTPPPHLLSLSLFSVIVSLFCTLLITFSACRACLDKDLDLKGSLQGARRSVVNLVLTWLMVAATFFVYFMVFMLVMVVTAALLSAVRASVLIPMAIITVIMVVGMVYMAIAFSLAKSVAILEEKPGWEAMRRSMYLIKGSRWTAVRLSVFYGVFSAMTLVVDVSEEAWVVWRWGAGGVSGSLQAFIAVCGMVSQVVLYMSCKSKHAEPTETLLAASARFGPQEAKYLDLETAALAPTIVEE